MAKEEEYNYEPFEDDAEILLFDNTPMTNLKNCVRDFVSAPRCNTITSKWTAQILLSLLSSKNNNTPLYYAVIWTMGATLKLLLAKWTQDIADVVFQYLLPTHTYDLMALFEYKLIMALTNNHIKPPRKIRTITIDRIYKQNGMNFHRRNEDPKEFRKKIGGEKVKEICDYFAYFWRESGVYTNSRYDFRRTRRLIKSVDGPIDFFIHPFIKWPHLLDEHDLYNHIQFRMYDNLNEAYDIWSMRFKIYYYRLHQEPVCNRIYTHHRHEVLWIWNDTETTMWDDEYAHFRRPLSDYEHDYNRNDYQFYF